MAKTTQQLLDELNYLLQALRAKAEGGEVRGASDIITRALGESATMSSVRRYMSAFFALGVLSPAGKGQHYIDMTIQLEFAEVMKVRLSQPTKFEQAQEATKQYVGKQHGKAVEWASVHLLLGTQWELRLNGQTFTFYVEGDLVRKKVPYRVPVTPALGLMVGSSGLLQPDFSKRLRQLPISALYVHSLQSELRRAK